MENNSIGSYNAEVLVFFNNSRRVRKCSALNEQI